MDKQTLLLEIKDQVSKNLITKEDLIQAYNAGNQGKDSVITRRFGIAEILYYVGGLIVFLGISLFVFLNWQELPTVTKILVTLGSGIAAYIVGILFSKEKNMESVGQAFFLISALVNPIGISVTFNIAGYDVGSSSIQIIISAILLLAYLSSYIFFKKLPFLLFSIIFGTWLFFSITQFIVGSNPAMENAQFAEYRILLTGLSYLFLGYAFQTSEKRVLTSALYGFGIVFSLGAALALGDWSPRQNIFWELLFPILALGTIFLSTYIKSKAFLVFGSLFLMLYILKITSEYFSQGLGWPVALILAGLALIAIGYYSIQLNKKYFSTSI